eukprot:NODE_407_length_9242_cov_0.441868.p3 type:complete len:263 gc:universal NODE_407_length_9242_cov_0.441868:1427-2215(+)
MPAMPIDMQFPEHSGLPGYIWYSVHSCALFSESLSVIGSVYIFYKSFCCYKQDKLTPMRVLPLMISIGDFLYAVLHGSDHSYAVNLNKGPSGDVCYMFGLFLWIPWNICIFSSTATAWYTYSTITKKQSPKTGKYYWRMIVPVFLGSFVPPVLATLTGMTAPNGFYCDIQGWFTLYQIVANNIILGVLIFFYVRSYICLKEHVGELMALSYKRMQNPFELSIAKMENVMHKLGSYLLIQIFLLAWADLYSILSFTVPDITQW